MTLPFTLEQFLGVFAAYNAAIWPAQLPALGLGLVAVALVCWRPSRSSRAILVILALMWLGNGVAYHALFFSSINPMAWLFAVAFVLQAVLLAAVATHDDRLSFWVARDFRTAAGFAAIVYSLLIYPAIGQWSGHGFMAGPMFGVAPCPTTIFTIGLLLLARGHWVVRLSVIPILWSAVSLAAALQLGIPEDFGLPVAALVLTGVLAAEKRRARSRETQAARKSTRSEP